MDTMEDKLGTILNNPQMMQQIMSMAQALGQSGQQEPPQQAVPQPSPSFTDLDPAMIGKIASFAGKNGIDENQKTLLKALRPYLTEQRISKLEKAMRAAKLAGLASSLLGSGVLQF